LAGWILNKEFVMSPGEFLKLIIPIAVATALLLVVLLQLTFGDAEREW